MESFFIGGVVLVFGECFCFSVSLWVCLQDWCVDRSFTGDV